MVICCSHVSRHATQRDSAHGGRLVRQTSSRTYDRYIAAQRTRQRLGYAARAAWNYSLGLLPLVPRFNLEKSDVVRYAASTPRHRSASTHAAASLCRVGADSSDPRPILLPTRLRPLLPILLLTHSAAHASLCRAIAAVAQLVPINAARLIDRLMEVHGHEVLIDGCFNADPHACAAA